MSPAGFECAIRAGEGPQTYALDRTATGDRRAVLHAEKSEKFRFEFHAH